MRQVQCMANGKIPASFFSLCMHSPYSLALFHDAIVATSATKISLDFFKQYRREITSSSIARMVTG